MSEREREKDTGESVCEASCVYACRWNEVSLKVFVEGRKNVTISL